MLKTLSQISRVRSTSSRLCIRQLTSSIGSETTEINVSRTSTPDLPTQRLLPQTLKARAYRPQIVINKEVSDAIGDNILSGHVPSSVRLASARWFAELQKPDSLHRAARTAMEVDAHIAAFFPHNYAVAFQCLTELKRRKPLGWNPRRILEVGYGPATGILALNDLLGPEYIAESKDCVILGHSEMHGRAKILLSRQINEIPENFKPDTPSNEDASKERYIGPVATNKITVRTNLRNRIPRDKQYDLILLTHQMLQTTSKFTSQIENNVKHYLKMLSPGGYLVIMERGNPLGFETIARARQIMVRPERYPNEHGKIPRPWQTSEQDHNNKNTYHLKIIAPCPHQRTCPLQTGNPNFYQHKEGKGLKFCNFQKSIKRSKFSIELKKGKVLAAPWNDPKFKTKTLKGSGRANGNDFEITNYSYLIMERSMTDKDTVRSIEEARESSTRSFEIGSLGDDTIETWPRILAQPVKRKGHVMMDLCGASGNLEKWTIPKSFSKEIFHDARKAEKGDLWGLDAKTKIKGKGDLNLSKLEALEKQRVKELKRTTKIERLSAISVTEFEKGIEEDEKVNDYIKRLADAHGRQFSDKH